MPSNPPAAPTAIPPTGAYDVTQLVTLLCSTPGAAIHYTTDGTPPTPSSPVFDPYKLIPTIAPAWPEEKSTHTIRAIAVKDGIASDPAIFSYQIERRRRDEWDCAAHLHAVDYQVTGYSPNTP